MRRNACAELPTSMTGVRLSTATVEMWIMARRGLAP
jgi:hypothetical protein